MQQNSGAMNNVQRSAPRNAAPIKIPSTQVTYTGNMANKDAVDMTKVNRPPKDTRFKTSDVRFMC